MQWFPGKTPKGGTPEENAAHIAAVVSGLKAIDTDIVLLQEIRDSAALQEIVKAIPEYSLNVVSNSEVFFVGPGARIRFNLSPDQLRRGLDRLEARGLIETAQEKRRGRYRHIRFL